MANGIKIGNIDISSFKVGSGDCKVYLGDTLLYPTTQPSYKLVAQYSDTTEYKVECDGSSALTSTEVSGHTTPKSAMTSAVVSACDNATFNIDTNAFYGCSAMTAVTLDDNITELGGQSFFGCSALTSFHFPSGLTKISATILRLCNGITEISGIPSGVTYLGSGCFADMAGLTAATIPASVTGSSTNIFLRDSNLKVVHFEGRTPPALGNDSFKNCTSLQKIYIPDCSCYDSYAAQSQFSALTNIIYAEDQTKCKAESYPYAFKREHNGGSAYTRACSSSSADTITSAMTRSGTTMSTISGTSKQVTAITVGDCTKTIDNGAFSGWTKVQNIIISDSVETIGTRAFTFATSAYTSSAGLILGQGIKTIKDYAFYHCNRINDIVIPSGVTTISGNAFSYCTYMKKIAFKNGFNPTNFGESVFSYCGIQKLTIPGSLNAIPNSTFESNSSLTSLTINEGVTSIGQSAFQSCSGLTSIVIPNSVTTIGKQAFYNNKFTTFDIGSGVTSIGESALYNTTMTKLICRATTPPTCGTSAFGSWSSGSMNYPQIYVPDSSVNAYKNASFWSTQSGKIHPLSDLN